MKTAFQDSIFLCKLWQMFRELCWLILVSVIGQSHWVYDWLLTTYDQNGCRPPKTIGDHGPNKKCSSHTYLWSATSVGLVVLTVGHNRSAKGPRLSYDCHWPSHVDRRPSATSCRPSYDKSLPMPPICTDCRPMVGDWLVTCGWLVADWWWTSLTPSVWAGILKPSYSNRGL